MLLAKLVAGAALVTMTATLAWAELPTEPSPAPSTALTATHSCAVPIKFPQGKEELSLRDIRTAIYRYLIELGLEASTPDLRVTSDDTVVATIVGPSGGLSLMIEVDPATAQVIEFRARDTETREGLARQTAYNARLRRHVMGDGKPWGSWVGAKNARVLCGNDYRPEAPVIPETSAP